jgi:putative transposase
LCQKWVESRAQRFCAFLGLYPRGVGNPIRVEAPGAMHHVAIQAVDELLLFRDQTDRDNFAQVVTACLKRHSWVCYAHCLMDTHAHLLIRTVEPDLRAGAQWLSSVYARGFNRRHGRRGRLLNGPYSATLIQTQGHLLEVCRYIWLNPVRANICLRPEDWWHSSYRATLGLVSPLPFLQPWFLLRLFDPDPAKARAKIRAFVEDAVSTSPALY